jgi:membrane-associated phospholipid phosphatase
MAVAATQHPPSAKSGHAYSRLVRVIALVAVTVYLIGISAYLLTHGGWPTPDYLIPPLLLLAIALGRGWSFLLDWGPFLLLVLSWQATAGIAKNLGAPVHFFGPIDADIWLFRGRLPTFELQQRLYTPGEIRWYDWVATVQHALHFVLPVAVGLVIWLRSRRTYWRYLASVLLLFYLGFAGYALYPAAPPWLAASHDFVPPVERIAIETLAQLPAAAPIGFAYKHFSPNEVAAMPSLHAALPMLLALVLIRVYGWKLLPVVLYPLLMGYNLVYLGEHYVVDALVGYALAFLAYLVVWVLPDLAPRWQPVHRQVRWPVPSPALHRAGTFALLVVAFGSIGVIAFTLRPSRPLDVQGPLIPGLAVQAGQPELLAPTPCDLGASPSLVVDTLLGGVAQRYAAFLYDVEDQSCFTLTANPGFEPVRAVRIPALVQRAPVRLAPRMRDGEANEYYSLRVGLPAPELIEAGLVVDHRYMLAVILADVTDPEAAAQAVDELSNRALLAGS